MVVDDIRTVYTRHLDGEKPLTDDEFANVMIGIEKLYDIKFYNLFSTFEKYIQEVHKCQVDAKAATQL